MKNYKTFRQKQEKIYKKLFLWQKRNCSQNSLNATGGKVN